MKRKTSLMKAAEKCAQDRFAHNRLVGYDIKEAFEAGARWQKRQDIAAVKKACIEAKHHIKNGVICMFCNVAIQAIKKGGGV